MLASGKIRLGDLPPSSRVTRLRLLDDYVSVIARAGAGGLPLSSKLLYLLSSKGRSGKGDLVDVDVRRQGRTDLAITCDDIDDTRRKTSFFDVLSKLYHSNRTLLGAFVDEGASGGQRSSDLKSKEDRGAIPCTDAGTNTERVILDDLSHSQTEGHI